MNRSPVGLLWAVGLLAVATVLGSIVLSGGVS